MKTILRFSLLAASACLWADEAADRIAIHKVMAALSEARRSTDTKALSALFVSDAARSELEYLSAMDGRLLDASNRPWSEVTVPRIVAKSIHFATPDVAVVDASNTQYGSVVLVRSVPVLFVMKRQGEDWRIDSLRVLAEVHLNR